ncbi:MAG TPA: tRNA glutamyl-Q(34) synthetase GluQRS [Hyphomicrobiales bacterium]|nr:tRNA glutamyl-Q(34) synthetase GluQRS [Hyphomicrobiales bacterium]
MSGAFRFAPSPNGRLHLGHAFSALVNQALARSSGAHLLLRIEDIDPARSRASFAAAIRADLRWLGFAWDAEHVQSDNAAAHAAALAALRDRGLVYPCFCSRTAIKAAVAARGPDWPRDPDGQPLYPGTCRALDGADAAALIAAGRPHAWRLDMAQAAAATGPLSWQERGPPLADFVPAPEAMPPLGALLDPAASAHAVAAAPAAWGDVVLARRDAPASYHLAVVVDDAGQGVGEVVRGRDLYFATAVQRLLQTLLGLPAPLYRHHPLVLDASGRKLAKSTGAPSLAALMAAGAMPGRIRAALGLGDG